MSPQYCSGLCCSFVRLCSYVEPKCTTVSRFVLRLGAVSGVQRPHTTEMTCCWLFGRIRTYQLLVVAVQLVHLCGGNLIPKYSALCDACVHPCGYSLIVFVVSVVLSVASTTRVGVVSQTCEYTCL